MRWILRLPPSLASDCSDLTVCYLRMGFKARLKVPDDP